MTAPAGDPAYNPTTWKLAYQTRPFGIGADPAPANGNVHGTNDIPSSVLGALASPPANMTSAASKNTDVTQTTGKSTSPTVPPNQ